jgi:hypothetical protein
MLSLFIGSFTSSWISSVDWMVEGPSPYWIYRLADWSSWNLYLCFYWTSHLLATLCTLLASIGTAVISTILHFLFEGNWSSLARLINFFLFYPDWTANGCFIASLLQRRRPASAYTDGLPLGHRPASMLLACLYAAG